MFLLLFLNKMKFEKNKTILVPSLPLVCEILTNSCNQCSCDFLYSNSCALMHNSDDNINHEINIWRTNTMFNYWHNNFNSLDYDNFLVSMKYKIDKNAIIIEKIIINDNDFVNKYNNKRFLSDIKAKKLVKSLIKYIENIAKEEEKKFIISYVSDNLKSYNKYFKDEKFKLTEQTKICRTESNSIILYNEIKKII